MTSETEPAADVGIGVGATGEAAGTLGTSARNELGFGVPKGGGDDGAGGRTLQAAEAASVSTRKPVAILRLRGTPGRVIG